MKKLIITAVFVSLMGCGASTASVKEADTAAKQQAPMPMSTKRGRVFEERAGTWKATCDQLEDSKIYCRMFHIEQFGEWKTKNFVQLGPAWSPDAVGFVVATYLGFKEGTIVTIGIDKHARHEITAPKGNNLMLSPEHAEKLHQEMESGNKIVLTFNSYSGVRHLTLADLESYKELLVKVKAQLAKNSQ